MKLKRKIGIGLAVAAATYCVLAYIFMWPPIVRPYPDHSSADACMHNLKEIDEATKQFALEYNKKVGDTVRLQDLTPYIKLNSQGKISGCPAGGVYSVSAIGLPPICSCSTNPSVKTRIDCFYYVIYGPTPKHPHRLQ